MKWLTALSGLQTSASPCCHGAHMPCLTCWRWENAGKCSPFSSLNDRPPIRIRTHNQCGQAWIYWWLKCVNTHLYSSKKHTRSSLAHLAWGMIVKHCTFKSVVYFGSGWVGLKLNRHQLNLTAFVYSQSSVWIGHLEDVRSAALLFSTHTNAQSWIRNQTVSKYMQSREHLYNDSSPTRIQWKAFISSVLSGVSPYLS